MPAVIVITTTIIITAVITIAAVAIVVIAIAATPATIADQTSDWAGECAIRTAACAPSSLRRCLWARRQ
jgi:hypothetical protein